MKLLREWQEFKYDKNLLEQSKKEGKFLMRGIAQRASVINQNQRLYPLNIIQLGVENYQKLIQENRAYGEADHPLDRAIVELQHVSHIVREMTIDKDGVVWATIEVFDAPTKGGIIREIANKGGTIGISSRGLGETRNEDGVELVTQWDPSAWDLVCDPSTPRGFMVKENKEFNKSEFNKIFNKSDRIDRILNEIIK